MTLNKSHPLSMGCLQDDSKDNEYDDRVYESTVLHFFVFQNLMMKKKRSCLSD